MADASSPIPGPFSHDTLQTGGGLLTRRTALMLAGGAALAACGRRSAEPTANAAPQILSRARADHVIVRKGARNLDLASDGKVFKTYKIALGFAPEGHKVRDMDGRTPEGVYWIDRRNPRSAFHLSIGISYPNAADLARARALGLNPGGNIFIHGEPNNGVYKRGTDWTAGCIAVSNDEMDEIWATVPTGTQITILT